MTGLLNYGSGIHGSPTFASGTTVINTYAKVTTIAADARTLSIASITAGTISGFVIGDEVMLHVSGGSDTSYVGNYGFFKIESVGTNSLYLDAPCTSIIPAASVGSYSVQIVKVAQYQDVTISSSATLVAKGYDGSTGGILAMRVRGVLALNGLIDASKRATK